MTQAPIVCLVGPTGVGKSEVGLELAERWGAEIVAADSRQVYRGLDLGTAKPTPEDRDRVPHHMIDVAEPDQPYNAGQYERDARRCIDALVSRGAKALVVGGTGLYLRALLWGLCNGPQADHDFRVEWRERERESPGASYRRLSDVDPQAAASIHPHDLPKILRAIEVYALTGVPLSVLHDGHGFRTPRYSHVLFGLRRDREDLYRRIDMRVGEMMARGLVDEVEGLRRRGYGAHLPAMRAVGYRQILDAIEGRSRLDEAANLIARETRRYAKRQMTWFGANRAIRWIDLRPESAPSEVADHIMACLETNEAEVEACSAGQESR